MPSQNAYIVDQNKNPLNLNAVNLSPLLPVPHDENDIIRAHAIEDMDIAGDVHYERLLNQPVPVTVIFLDLFGTRRTLFTVSRQAHDLNWDALFDEICDFLDIDDNVIWEVSGIRVEATDDEAGRPYPAHLLFNRNAIPAGVLDQPRDVDLGIIINRQMNVRNYIREQLYDLLHYDMLNLNAPDGTYHIPARKWTITMTASEVQFPWARPAQNHVSAAPIRRDYRH